MYSSVLKLIWIVSLVTFLVALLYIYAALPQEVSIAFNELLLVASRSALFYIALAVAACANALAFPVESLWGKESPLSHWLLGQLALFNFFMIIALGLIMTINSGEKFNYTQISLLVYGGVAALIAWPVGSLGYFLIKGQKK